MEEALSPYGAETMFCVVSRNSLPGGVSSKDDSGRSAGSSGFIFGFALPIVPFLNRLLVTDSTFFWSYDTAVLSFLSVRVFTV